MVRVPRSTGPTGTAPDDLTGGGHQHQVDRQLDAGGLVGGHLGAEHLGRCGLHIIDGLAELDAASLAAAASVDLRLDHPGPWPSDWATSTASSGVAATLPAGTGMPYSASSCFAGIRGNSCVTVGIGTTARNSSGPLEEAPARTAAGPLLWPSRRRGAKKSVQNARRGRIFAVIQAVAPAPALASGLRGGPNARCGRSRGASAGALYWPSRARSTLHRRDVPARPQGMPCRPAADSRPRQPEGEFRRVTQCFIDRPHRIDSAA